MAALVVCALGLLGMSLMLQSPDEAGKSLLAAAAGVAAAWLLVVRSGGWKSRLAYGWLIAASFLAIIPGIDTRVSLIAIPPALWLLAVGAHPRRLPTLLIGLWKISVLAAVGQSSWMLVFVGAAFMMLRVGGKSREGWGLAAVAVIAMAVLSGIRAAQLGMGIVELWTPAACGRPIAWLMVSEAGWFGHGVAPCAVFAAAPSLCTEWGWIGLGMASVLIVGMIACCLALVVLLPTQSAAARALAAGFAGLAATHVALHVGLLIGLRVHLLTLPGIGPAPETFVESCVFSMLYLASKDLPHGAKEAGATF